MKKIFAFICCFGLLGLNASAADVDVYILAGQSNMDGRGVAEQLPEQLRSVQREVLIYYAHPADPKKQGEEPTRSDAWQPVGAGYSVPTRSRRIELPSKTFGPEVSFAHAMNKAQPKGNRLAILKVSRGGTNLKSDWSPTGYMYQGLVKEIDKSLKALADKGHAATVRGVLWHQGESDSRHVQTYPGELETLIANLREKLASPTLPFLIGELAPTKPKAFREMQRKIAADNEGVFFVSSAELTTADKTHFDAASQVTLGQRFADVFLTEVSGESSTAKPDDAATDETAHHNPSRD